MPEDHDQGSDVVRVKYINFNSIKFLLFTKLESNTSQRQANITYEIISGVDSRTAISYHAKYSDTCFQNLKSMLHVTKNNWVILITYNNSNIEQLSIWSC